jgi:crossover junction endodeoxyribonuclease RuvC
MRVLGVDPGYHRTGVAIVERQGNALKLIESKLIETERRNTLAKRLSYVFDGVASIISQFLPEAVAVEELFFSKNVKTAMGVAHARGVVLLAADRANLPVFEYKPSIVKLAVTSNGAATKDQVLFMVKRLVGADLSDGRDDEIDAIAVAICHAFKHGKDRA